MRLRGRFGPLSDNGSGFIEGEALNVRCSHIEPKDQVVLRHRDVLICQVLGSFFFGPEVTDAECTRRCGHSGSRWCHDSLDISLAQGLGLELKASRRCW